MLIEIIFLILGAFAVFLVDIIWWTIDFKKVEKGLEFHEHYHVGLELLIISIALSYIDNFFIYLLVGAGFAFIMAEWRQTVEIADKKVQPGHPFAYLSLHFHESTIVGIILVGILVTLVIIKTIF